MEILKSLEIIEGNRNVVNLSLDKKKEGTYFNWFVNNTDFLGVFYQL